MTKIGPLVRSEEHTGPGEVDEDAPSFENEEAASIEDRFQICCSDLGIPGSTLRLATPGQRDYTKKRFGLRDFVAVECIQLAAHIVLPVISSSFPKIPRGVEF